MPIPHLRLTVQAVARCITVGLMLLTQTANAQQIRGDNTLTVPTDVSTLDNQKFTIEGGTRQGSNLFHSFEGFSIPSNGAAIFNNSTEITHIINRITGEQTSSIDGLIKTQGSSTNLFFLNPNGIVFGPNAQLEIGGSFIASTAERLKFTNNVELLTDGTSLDPLLSISAPVGLQLSSASGGIVVNDFGHTPLSNIPLMVDSSASLRVNPGRTLALIGNGIDFNGGVVAAPGGSVEIGSVRTGTVGFDNGSGRFDYKGVDQFSEMTFGSRSLVDASSLLFNATDILPYVSGVQGGNIQLQGDRIRFEEDSRAIIQNYGAAASGSIRAVASDVLELATETVGSGRDAGLSTASFGAGSGGNIEVVAPRVVLIGDVNIGTDTYGSADGGNVTITAENSIRFEPDQGEIPDYAEANTIAYSGGKAGRLSVVVRDLVMPGGVLTSLSIGSGAGGLVKVNANRIVLTDGGSITSGTLFSGQGGDVEVTADVIDISGINPFSFVPSLIEAPTVGTGNAGNVTINTRQLYLRNGGRIGSSTLADGDAGTVTVMASKRVSVDGTVPGSINPTLIISSANIVDPLLRTFFREDAGVVLPAIPTGNSGNVAISAPELAVTDGAQVTVRNDGTGDAGTLMVSAKLAYLSDRAGITASTQAGSGGNIVLNLKEGLLLREGSRLSAAAGSAGSGGNIALNTPVVVALENSDISASAVQGAGGNVQISTGVILGTAFRDEQTPESDITVSSEFGVSGEVEISSIEGDPSSGTVALPENLADASSQIVAGCSSTSAGQFVASGRGGLPPNPMSALQSNRPWQDMRARSPLSSTHPASTIAPHDAADVLPIEPPLAEASAWIVNEQGQITLIQRSLQRSLQRPSVLC